MAKTATETTLREESKSEPAVAHGFRTPVPLTPEQQRHLREKVAKDVWQRSQEPEVIERIEKATVRGGSNIEDLDGPVEQRNIDKDMKVASSPVGGETVEESVRSWKKKGGEAERDAQAGRKNLRMLREYFHHLFPLKTSEDLDRLHRLVYLGKIKVPLHIERAMRQRTPKTPGHKVGQPDKINEKWAERQESIDSITDIKDLTE